MREDPRPLNQAPRILSDMPIIMQGTQRGRLMQVGHNCRLVCTILTSKRGLAIGRFQRDKHSLLNIAVVVATATVMTACGSVSSQPTSTTTPLTSLPPVSESSVVPALQTHNPKVVVRPSTNLVDGEKVKVTVTGFGEGGKLFLSECASIADANSAGCGEQLAGQPFIVTDDSGHGTETFSVSTVAGTKPYNTTSTEACTDQCVLLVTTGIDHGYAYAPLSFAGG